MDIKSIEDKIDPEIKEIIQGEQIRAQISSQIRKLNKICFAKCVDKISPKFEGKVETCLNNCVNRYLDTNEFIAHRFQQRAGGPPQE